MSRLHLSPEGKTVSSFDLRTVYHVLLDRAWVIAVCVVVTLLLAAGYIQRTPNKYASTATLQVEQEEQRVVKFERVQQEDLRSLEILRTIEQTLKSRALLERVIDVNKLAENPAFIADIQPLDSKNGQSSKNADPSAVSMEQLVKQMDKILTVKLRRGTRLIDITVSHANPELTAKIANSLVQEFIRQGFEQQSSSTRVANEFLLAEADRLKKKLEESEHALQDYREKTKSASMEDRQNVVAVQFKELGSRVTEARAARIKAEGAYMQVKALSNNIVALSVLSVVAENPEVSQLKTELSKQENNFANLAQRYKSKHPKYIQALTQLEDLRARLTEAVLKVVQTVKTSFEGALTDERSLEEALKEQEAAALEVNKLSIQYNVLAREVESDRAMYESILTRMKETSLAKDLQIDKVRPVQEAFIPEEPVWPKKVKIILGALFVGLLMGFASALGLNAVDNSFKTVDQVEEETGLPVLSAVPQIKDNKKGQRPIIVKEDAKSPGAEAFRTLRTSLSMLGRAEDRRVFLFTSALPQEGKTFTSVNYSVCLAQQGLRCLLIDGDLRRPAVEEMLVGKQTQLPGVTNLLTGQKKLSDIIQRTEIENFCYLSAGTTAPNPAELLAQNGITPIIDEALQFFDRIIIDTAPIHAVSDTLLMMDRVQTVCMVTRAGKTPRRAVIRALQLLRKAEAPLAGIVLNRLRHRIGSAYYYDPYYNYSYHGKYTGKGVYGA